METDLAEECQREAAQAPSRAGRPQAMRVVGWVVDFLWVESLYQAAGLLCI